MSKNFTPVPNQTFYTKFEGGLDLMTPAITMPPGRCIDAQNYEPETSGGYRRIDGHERFDGRTSPTATGYWLIPVTLSATVAVGDTITGATSGATAKVLKNNTTELVVGDLTGTFVSENFTVAAAVKGTCTAAQQNAAATQSLNADYRLLSANNQRSKILTVPGSGKIRGVWLYKDVWYAFRDNAAGTAGDMYKSTSSGWVKVTFGTEVQFSSTTGGTTPIAVGNVIADAAAPTKTATVVAVLTRSGTWGTDALGTLIITPILGTFANGDNIYVGATKKGVTTSAATAITRAPGGTNGIVEFVNYNFTGSTATEKMYGCDGVNLAFEFDGTNYIPIRTGMATDTPEHIAAWKNYLILSFLGSVQLSSITSPYSWTVVLGANEIALGTNVSGMIPQTGNNAGSSLAIFSKQKTFILYGSSSANFQLVPSIENLGTAKFTMQQVGNDAFGLTARGIQKMITTLTYGDFSFSALSALIQDLMIEKLGLETASTTLSLKNQYRLYFSDGTGLAVGVIGAKISGIMPLYYGSRVVRCMATGKLSSGVEQTCFGSDDGYVYMDNIGTSFDGDVIESWVRLAFNNIGSPQLRKRFRRVVLEVRSTNYSQVSFTYDLGYGTPKVMPSATYPAKVLQGGGGYWDKFKWDNFTWDAQIVKTESTTIDGTEKNISLLFYSSRAQDSSHTLQGVTYVYSARRLER
jgi:hypothetical protein